MEPCTNENPLRYGSASLISGSPAMLSGSDYHRLGPPPTGGILTDEPIRTNDELYDVLVHRRFTPLHPGEMPVYYDAKIDEDIKK